MFTGPTQWVAYYKELYTKLLKHWVLHSKSSPVSPLSSLNSRKGEIAGEKAALLPVEGAEVPAGHGSFGGAACSLGEGRQPLSTGIRLTCVTHAEVRGNRHQHQTEPNTDSSKPPSNLIPQLPTPLEHQQILTPHSQIPDHPGNTNERKAPSLQLLLL